MNILLTGQCSLHWGRMEFGNIGNYYIIEPFIRELRRVFPGCEVRTTFQMSKRFCDDEGVVPLPIELFYGWTGEDLSLAKRELALAEKFNETGDISEESPYLEAVQWSDIVVDFSGDIWGDNADFLGPDRFEVGLMKDRVAQLMGKRTVMLAGSPGPFGDSRLKEYAQKVYGSFDLVTNREPVSTALLKQEGFDCSNTSTLACPAFLFEPCFNNKVNEVVKEIQGPAEKIRKRVVGFVLCGWNFGLGPFDKWPRDDSDYEVFASIVEYITEGLGGKVCLMSHSNGFDMPPAPFRLKHGRDYPIARQLYDILLSRGKAKDVMFLDGLYDAWETKAIVGSMDMLVSGRVHAAVAGLSQHVPTVIMDYGHEPKAHKLRGFAEVAGVQDYFVDPSSEAEVKQTVKSCWTNLDSYTKHLKEHMPSVRNQAHSHFDLLKRFD